MFDKKNIYGAGGYLELQQSYSKLWLVYVLVAILGLATWFITATHSSQAVAPCPCSVFTTDQAPVSPSAYNEPGGIELGFKVIPSLDGYISGIRFYKAAGMSGTHIASLWDRSGNRIANATFSSETAAGWQEVTFAPVAVTADTLYTASVFMTDGNYIAASGYFASAITNTPLTAPANDTPAAQDASGQKGQGVYGAAGVNAYPSNSFNNTNYWIDAVYISSTNSAAPTVTATTPTNGATGASLTGMMSASFDKHLDPATVSSDTVTLRNAAGMVIPGATSIYYDAATSTIKLIASPVLAANTTYTVTLSGGGTPAITDYEGHKLGVDYAWSFTTTTTPFSCPCSLQDNQAPNSASISYRNATANGLELGVKIVPNANGYITALRFYKPIISTQSTHTGNIWKSDGTLLSSVDFTHESEYGWQEATLSSPLPVNRDTTYIISYGTTDGIYQALVGGLAAPFVSQGLSAYPSGDSRNTATGSTTVNGVFATTSGTYPAQGDPDNTYFWTDAVFSAQSDQSSPLHVKTTQPSADSYGVMRDTTISAAFDQALDPLTVNASTVQVKKSSLDVTGTASYNAASHSIEFTPSTPLSYGATYTVTLSSGVTDVRGTQLISGHTWSFTIGSQLNSDINTGSGGPIVLFTNSADPYSAYYAEILRTEGITYFDVKDINTLTSNLLDSYTTAIMSPSAVTASQVSALTDWVQNGGSLVAIRPDKQLAPLLGLTDAHGSLTNGYLMANNATTAGMGIVNDTIQYKGVADTYLLNSATATATLFSDGATSTSYPAATSRAVGTGTAMSFSYDLARSIIGLHQGNLAWSAQDRDSDTNIRSTDLFYGPKVGDIQPDWLDITKMEIPQADEQQRLLVNMLIDAMKSHLPSPRFWYLPDNKKAALVLAGDDHDLQNMKGTEQTVNNFLNSSKSNCSVMDWQCVRASHYTYPSSGLTDSRANQFSNYGFEIANHPSNTNSCGIPPYSTVVANYANQLAAWHAKYTSQPNQQTSRFHCYLWPSWDMMPLIEITHNIHYDLNTVAYPTSWIGSRSPMVTGSGMNMRLTDTNGALIDVHQGVTNFDNTTATSANITKMFDNALGVNGYYGIFGSHYDMTDSYDKTLYAAAISRNVPMISSLQALQWLNGRNSSQFTDFSVSQTGNVKISFTVSAAEGAHGLQTMMPTHDANGTLTGVQQAGQPVSYQTDIIKGVEYALFAARPGTYTVSYSDTITTPTGTATETPSETTTKQPTSTGSSSVESKGRFYTTLASTKAQITEDKTSISPTAQTSSTKSTLAEPAANWWQTSAPWVTGSIVTAATTGGGWLLAGLRRKRNNF